MEEEKKYYYLVSGVSSDDFLFRNPIMSDEVHGPFSAKEMLQFNLPESTPVTDDIENERWKTVGDFDFEKIIRQKKSHNTNGTLRMEGATYQFYFEQDGEEHGPRTATEMLKLNLPGETPVTESSLKGEWFYAENFDFETLSEEEAVIHHESRHLSRKKIIAGLIWITVGIVATVVSYSNAKNGGTYYIAWGAVIFGLIQLFRGLFVGGDVSDTQYTYEESEGNSDEMQQEVSDIPPDKLAELYAELEITPDATDDEVKKAYRTLAKRYHPDRYSHAGEEEKPNATTRFRNITDAYELIRQLRNMK